MADLYKEKFGTTINMPYFIVNVFWMIPEWAVISGFGMALDY